MSEMLYSLYILSSLNPFKTNTGVCRGCEVLANFTVIFADISASCSEVSCFESCPTTVLTEVSRVVK